MPYFDFCRRYWADAPWVDFRRVSAVGPNALRAAVTEQLRNFGTQAAVTVGKLSMFDQIVMRRT